MVFKRKNQDQGDGCNVGEVRLFCEFVIHRRAYMQKTCDVAEKAILAKKKLRKKCVNRDKM